MYGTFAWPAGLSYSEEVSLTDLTKIINCEGTLSYFTDFPPKLGLSRQV
jgi:hypothetical protein